MPSKRLYDLGLFYCAFIWGSTFIVTKYALSSVDYSAMVAIRFLISAIALLPFVIKKKNMFSYFYESLLLACFLSALYLTQTLGLK